jgi:hypothetical protein
MSDLDLDATAIESLYARGVTDGLPVVPPTRALVERAVAATERAADDLVAVVPPNYGRATIEKIAINAVMAGCRSEYLPVVVAAVEAVCDDAFDLHGVSATTNAPAPLVIVNGPIRERLEINSGAGVFGPGSRANATIGRALRLVCLNLGGARPGAVSMSTLAHPGRYTYCIGEHEEASPWESLAVEHGDLVGVRGGCARPGRRAGRHGLSDGRGAAPDSAPHAGGSSSAGRQGVRRDPEADHGVRR